MYFLLGHYDEAMSWAAIALRDDPDHQPSLRICAASNAMAGLPTERLVAHVIDAKYQWHLPLYRQAQMLATHGIALDRSTLAFWVGYAAQHELSRLGDELLLLDPNLVVCLGNTTLWALGGITVITKFRGTTRASTHCVGGFKLLCTYHPSAVVRDWSLRPTTVADLSKRPVP